MTLALVGIVVLALGWAQTASAKGKTPPTIDQLVGTYQEKEKGVDYDLLSAGADKFGDQGTVTITKVDSTTVNLHFSLTGDTFDDKCFYGGGGPIITGSSDNSTLGTWCYFEVLTVGGKPGKLKAKGNWVYYDTNDGYYEVGSFSLKQTG